MVIHKYRILFHKHIYHTQKTIERQYHYAEKQKTGDLQNVHMTGIQLTNSVQEHDEETNAEPVIAIIH